MESNCNCITKHTGTGPLWKMRYENALQLKWNLEVQMRSQLASFEIFKF